MHSGHISLIFICFEYKGLHGKSPFIFKAIRAESGYISKLPLHRNRTVVQNLHNWTVCTELLCRKQTVRDVCRRGLITITCGILSFILVYVASSRGSVLELMISLFYKGKTTLSTSIFMFRNRRQVLLLLPSNWLKQNLNSAFSQFLSRLLTDAKCEF